MQYKIFHNGNVDDVKYFCNPLCIAVWGAKHKLGNEAIIPVSTPESNSDVHCAECGKLLWKAIETQTK